MTAEAPPPNKIARNEQRKLQATTFNALGLAFGAFGVVQPVVIGALTAEGILKVAICADRLSSSQARASPAGRLGGLNVLAVFLTVCGGLLFYALLLWIDEQRLKREWKRGMEADEAARKAAE